MFLSAQKSSLCWLERPRLTSRSLSDFFLRMTKRLLASAIFTTATSDTVTTPGRSCSAGGLRQAGAGDPDPALVGQHCQGDRVGQIERVEEFRLQGYVDETPGIDDGGE